MKSIRKILILSTIVFAIVLFWLVPGVNKARDVRYTRVYEDTDKKPKALRDSTNGRYRGKSGRALTTKIYKQESIYTNSKLSDIKPSMFSRGAQFSETKFVVELDSVNNAVALEVDSVGKK